ncbi:MAG: hypothetical protein ABSG99_07950 [Sedimentisphaerales bacterium]
MAKRKYLTQRQLTVLDDLFNSDLDEQGVLDKHKVRRSIYERWLADEVFAERFNRYVNSIRRRSELLMAKYSCLAAAKLVELTTSDKAETARRACLDIICQQKIAAEKNDGRGMKDEGREDGVENQQSNIAFSPETASRLLAAMAEEKILK